MGFCKSLQFRIICSISNIINISIFEPLIYVWLCLCLFHVQIHEEAKKFSYQTGVRVAVAYGGAPIAQQVDGLIFVTNCKSYFYDLVYL